MIQRRVLTVADFQYTQNLTNPVQISPVLTYTVPLKTVVFIDPTRPLNGNIMAVYEKELGSGDINNKTVTIQLPLKVSEVPEGVKNVVGIYDPGTTNEVAYGEVDPTDPTRRTVKITFTNTPATEKVVRVYYSVDNMYFDIAIVAPSTSETLTRVLLEGKLGYINSIHPFDIKQSDRLRVTRYVPALEDFQIQFRVRSDQVVTFERPESFIEIPVLVMDEGTAEAMFRQRGGRGVREALKRYFKMM